MRQLVCVKSCIYYSKGFESPPAGGLCARAGSKLSTSAATVSPILVIAEGRGSQVPKG